MEVRDLNRKKNVFQSFFTFTSTNLIQGLRGLRRPRFYEENLSQEEGSSSLAARVKFSEPLYDKKIEPFALNLFPRQQRSRMLRLGSFSNDDGDGNEDVKKATGLLRKTTTLHVHHAFCTFLYRPCTTTT